MNRTPQWFKEWRNGEFYHLKIKVNLTLWLSVAILSVLVGTLVVRFLFG